MWYFGFIVFLYFFYFLKNINAYSAWTLKICIATSPNRKAFRAFRISFIWLLSSFPPLIFMKCVFFLLNSMGIILLRVTIAAGLTGTQGILQFLSCFIFHLVFLILFFFNSSCHLWLQNLHFSPNHSLVTHLYLILILTLDLQDIRYSLLQERGCYHRINYAFWKSKDFYV